MTQFFLATNLEALTGRSHTSKVLTRVWKKRTLLTRLRLASIVCFYAFVNSIFDYAISQILPSVRWSYLCFMVPHTDAAVVQTGQHPWLSWVKVHTLHSVRPGCQPPLNVQPQRLKRQRTSVYFPTLFKLSFWVALPRYLMIW